MFLILNDQHSLLFLAEVSGEHKGIDAFRGTRPADTGVTIVYAGPQLVFTQGEKWSAEFSALFPVVRDNTALQIVPDYRLSGAVTLHF